MILIDTSVLSRAFRRRKPGTAENTLKVAVDSLLAGDDDIGLPGIVLQEVLSGIRSEQQFDELHQLLVGAFAIVHPTTTDHVSAAKLRNRCIAKGLNASGIDCLITTMAIARGAELFVIDDDFVAIAKHAPVSFYRG
jgi:predicted nucleic acid-binding protein